MMKIFFFPTLKVSFLKKIESFLQHYRITIAKSTPTKVNNL